MWHEFDESPNDAEGQVPAPADISAWRRSERQRQIDARGAIAVPERAAMSARIVEHLKGAILSFEGRNISLYWPIRGEPDLRSLIPFIVEAGGTCALPVVVAQGKPLVFRSFRPGEPLERGIWNIPVPASGREIEPDIAVAPVVAWDRASYRLGYGGGYFDRTLAGLAGRTRALGVGYAAAGIATIFPQPHDIAMDLIVTENGRFER
jgi:5,10-methenyltetrahydrofolate synthetase